MLLSKKLLNRFIPFIENINNEEMINYFNNIAIETESISNFKDYLKENFPKYNLNDEFKNDQIFELSIPNNRNDLNTVLSVSNELKALFKKPYFWYKNPKIEKINVLDINTNLENINYYALKISKYNYSSTTKEIQEILLASGINYKNNIDDIAKMTQLISGIPLLSIDTNNSNDLEIIKLEKDYILNIVDIGSINVPKNNFALKVDNKIAAIPGIGIVTGYEISTKTIETLFLGFWLDWIEFKKINSKLKIMSNCIKFYLKPISIFYLEQSFNILLDNLKSYKSKMSFKKVIKLPKKIQFEVDFKRINLIIGENFNKKFIKSNLKLFGIKFKNDLAIIPDWRLDLTNNNDLAEEIIKIININHLDSININNSLINLNQKNDYKVFENISFELIAKGFFHIKNYNLTSEKYLEAFNWDQKIRIGILNPISQERNFLRLSLLPGLLECYSYNSSHKNELFPIFEIQKIYSKKNSEIFFSFLLPKYLINNQLTGSNIINNIYICKDILSIIENKFNINFKYRTVSKSNFFYPNDALEIYHNNLKIGYIGKFLNSIVNELKIKSDFVYGGEIKLNSLLELNNINNNINCNFDKAHPIIKELTFHLKNEMGINQLYLEINKLEQIKNLKTISFFKKENIIAISIQFEMICLIKSNPSETFQFLLDHFKKLNILIPE
ncbi:MAG: hypothetical protein ACRCW6_01515 [Mycoplasmoidaceae bacterium]